MGLSQEEKQIQVIVDSAAFYSISCVGNANCDSSE